MGLSKKKTKTTTNQNTTATTTPTLPDWVSTNIQGLSNKVNDTFAGIDPHSLVSGPNDLQLQAGQGASSLATSPNFGQASDTLRSLSGDSFKGINPDDIQRFLNPQLKDVVDTSLADYDYGSGQTRAQNKLSLAGDSTFGGSGGAIQTALSEDNINRGRGTLAAGLRSDAYDRAAGLAATQAGLQQQDLSRRAGAATSLADVGSAQGANDRANIATQAGVGSDIRNASNEANASPITALMAQIAATGGLNLADYFKGTDAKGSLSGTSTGTTSGASLGDWLGFFAANANAAKSAAGGGG